MDRRRISSGSPLEAEAGYSRAVVVSDNDGETIYVSGTTGFDYRSMTIAEDVVEQAEQCFGNIKEALQQAGATLEHVVRANYILTDGADLKRLAPVFAREFGRAPPASTAIIAGLVDPRMKIEIEVTARVLRATRT